MAFSKIVLSGSINGRGILVTGVSASTANLVHTSITGAADYDELYIYAVNTATADRRLDLKYGVTVAGVTDLASRNIAITVTSQSGPVLLIPGWPLRDANLVEAFATVAGVPTGNEGLVIYGYAHRVT